MSICSCIALISIRSEVVKTKIWTEKCTIGGHMTIRSCLSRRLDRTTLQVLFVHKLVLQERDDHDLVRFEH
jgi:hypothetical protein